MAKSVASLSENIAITSRGVASACRCTQNSTTAVEAAVVGAAALVANEAPRGVHEMVAIDMQQRICRYAL
jgi:ADP-ribosylglycohydrolase